MSFRVDVTRYITHMIRRPGAGITVNIAYEVAMWLQDRNIIYHVHYNMNVASYYFNKISAEIEFINSDDMANFQLRWLILENE